MGSAFRALNLFKQFASMTENGHSITAKLNGHFFYFY